MLDQFDGDRYERPVAKEMYVCANCGGIIHEGEYYWDLEEGLICEECIDMWREVAENA